MKRLQDTTIVSQIELNLDTFLLIAKFLTISERLLFGETTKTYNQLAKESIIKFDFNNNFLGVKSHTILRNFPFLTKLNLSNNEIIEDSDLIQLTRLRTLDISHNRIITSEGISKLTRLTSLDLSDNKHVSDRGLLNLSNIKNLKLAANHTITWRAFYGKKLVKLDLSRFSIVLDNSIVSSLISLRSLKLSYSISMSNEILVELTNLTSLSLENNEIIKNESIMKLTKLVNLNLVENDIISQEAIFSLTNLERLIISYTNPINAKLLAPLLPKLTIYLSSIPTGYRGTFSFF